MKQCRSLLFAKAYLPNECMRFFPGLISNPIHLRKALKMCALPSVKASPSKEITVTCYAKQKSYCLVKALQSCLHLRTTGSTKNKPRCIFKFPDELDQCTEPPLILGPLFISSQKLSAPAYCKIPEADEALKPSCVCYMLADIPTVPRDDYQAWFYVTLCPACAAETLRQRIEWPASASRVRTSVRGSPQDLLKKLSCACIEVWPRRPLSNWNWPLWLMFLRMNPSPR